MFKRYKHGQPWLTSLKKDNFLIYNPHDHSKSFRGYIGLADSQFLDTICIVKLVQTLKHITTDALRFYIFYLLVIPFSSSLKMKYFPYFVTYLVIL